VPRGSGGQAGAAKMSFMARDLETMVRDALELSEGDRATLAGLLIESLEPPPDAEVGELWAVEEERRWQEIESGAVQTVPWEEVRARLFRRG
jgi:putative addiction module component (TIGR02574 family)